MKKLLAFICLLAACTGPLWAQKAGEFGAGVVLGNPTGITGKYWLNSSKALDGGLGFDSDVMIYGDYLWHSYTVVPQPAEGKMPLYLGLGLQVGDTHRHFSNDLGLRAVGGISYWLPRNPVELFFELVPVFHLSEHGGSELNAGIGLRYYFL
jgi:hypothetical protein